MTRTEYYNLRRKKFAKLKKNRVDAAYEYYCSLSEEEKLIAEFTFASKLAKHLGLSLGIARNTTSNLIAEYQIEFCKRKPSNPSFGFAGKKHSAETRAAMSKAAIARNKARAIRCSEQGIRYRTYVQDAEKQIVVPDFFNSTRIETIDTDKIII
jgi:hypothetical protein